MRAVLPTPNLQPSYRQVAHKNKARPPKRATEPCCFLLREPLLGEELWQYLRSRWWWLSWWDNPPVIVRLSHLAGY